MIRKSRTEMAEAKGLAIPFRLRNRASGSISRKTKKDRNTGAASWYSLLKPSITRYTVSTTRPISNNVRQYFFYRGSIDEHDSFFK
ncbi:hypothetical protein D3C72_2181890 [compost metagenome]